jgi:hypothetical protein
MLTPSAAGPGRVERVLGVDERRDAAGLLGAGGDGQRERGLTRALRAEDLDDAALGDAATAQGQVERERAGGDARDREVRVLVEAHDRALADSSRCSLRRASSARSSAAPRFVSAKSTRARSGRAKAPSPSSSIRKCCSLRRNSGRRCCSSERKLSSRSPRKRRVMCSCSSGLQRRAKLESSPWRRRSSAATSRSCVLASGKTPRKRRTCESRRKKLGAQNCTNCRNS